MPLAASSATPLIPHTPRHSLFTPPSIAWVISAGVTPFGQGYSTSGSGCIGSIVVGAQHDCHESSFTQAVILSFFRSDLSLKLRSGAMELRIEKPSFKYTSGQWLFLQVPELSRWQWHPVGYNLFHEVSRLILFDLSLRSPRRLTIPTFQSM
jgi:hypothetical protein